MTSLPLSFTFKFVFWQILLSHSQVWAFISYTQLFNFTVLLGLSSPHLEGFGLRLDLSGIGGASHPHLQNLHSDHFSHYFSLPPPALPRPSLLFDTCCIDKRDAVELQEAINSMFSWYKNSTKCYVYLPDVSRPRTSSTDDWILAFRESVWFSRGWNLQELIAPTSVDFYCKERELLGDKTSLEGHICEVTGIPAGALQGSPLSDFSIAERFSWAANRLTFRQEDKAYSLLGMFGVNMPLIYGEGYDSAVKRLRKEVEGTSRSTGKSTIARTVAREYHQKERLGASFFFSRGDGDVSHAGKFFTSVAVQLANNTSPVPQYVNDAVAKCRDIANQSLRDQWHQLIIRPLSLLACGSPNVPYLLVIDALDECDKEEHIRIILQLLAEAGTLKTIRLRVFVTSRPEVPIRHGIAHIPETKRQDFVLHNMSPSIVDHDITVFLQYKLSSIASAQSLGAGWPGEKNVKQLVDNASGLFIWAATACRFISEGRRFATKRLTTVLESSSNATNAPGKHLDEIYLRVLRHSICLNYTAEETGELCCALRNLLGSNVTLFSLLSIRSLSRLINISEEEVVRTLDDLHAILNIPPDPTCSLRLHHPSFRDFLLDTKRCEDSSFQVNEKQAHERLARFCITLMSTHLKQDICQQKTPDKLAADLESSQLDQFLPPELQYACLYWVQHLQKSDTHLCDDGQVHQFFQIHKRFKPSIAQTILKLPHYTRNDLFPGLIL